MFRGLIKGKTSDKMGSSGSKEKKEPTKIGGSVAKWEKPHRNQLKSNPAGPFADKDSSSLRVLIRCGGDREMSEVLESINKDYGEDKASIVSKIVHREINTNSLTLSGYQLVAMTPRQHFSRMRNFEADLWDEMAHKNADAFVYLVHFGQTEEYFDGGNGWNGGNGWERDRYQISTLLRNSALVENPKKPLLLLVNNDEDDEFDVEHLVNLFGLGGNRFGRPFRACCYSATESDANNGALKESLEWLTKTARSSEDEDTVMTGSDTEEDGSVVTSTTIGTIASSSYGGHYILDYEPTLLGGNPTLQSFEPIKKGTHCPFARAAKLWGGKLADELKPRLSGHVDSLQEAANLNAGPLAEFVARSKNGGPLDGFCLEIPEAAYMSVEKLGEKVLGLLTKLADMDPSPGENAMEMGPIDQPQWRFRFAGEDFFLTTFSPIYGKDSSRHTFGVHKTFLLFQPITSFGRHGLTEDTPASATKWDNPTSMRDKARVAFKENGCPYHIPEKLPYPVAEHIVKPKMDDGTGFVRWWQPPSTDHHSV